MNLLSILIYSYYQVYLKKNLKNNNHPTTKHNPNQTKKPKKNPHKPMKCWNAPWDWSQHILLPKTKPLPLSSMSIKAKYTSKPSMAQRTYFCHSSHSPKHHLFYPLSPHLMHSSLGICLSHKMICLRSQVICFHKS